MILQMTELNRHRRVQTVEVAIDRLRRYREQAADYAVDFHDSSYRESPPTEREDHPDSSAQTGSLKSRVATADSFQADVAT